MRRVGTPILGRPRPLPRQRRASHPYTLKCEEPVYVPLGEVSKSGYCAWKTRTPCLSARAGDC
jgi:hypothetical protein